METRRSPTSEYSVSRSLRRRRPGLNRRCRPWSRPIPRNRGTRSSRCHHRPRSGARRGAAPPAARAGCPPRFRGPRTWGRRLFFFRYNANTWAWGILGLVVMETIRFTGRRLSAIFSEPACIFSQSPSLPRSFSCPRPQCRRESQHMHLARISLDCRHHRSRQQENDRSDGLRL